MFEQLYQLLSKYFIKYGEIAPSIYKIFPILKNRLLNYPESAELNEIVGVIFFYIDRELSYKYLKKALNISDKLFKAKLYISYYYYFKGEYKRLNRYLKDIKDSKEGMELYYLLEFENNFLNIDIENFKDYITLCEDRGYIPFYLLIVINRYIEAQKYIKTDLMKDIVNYIVETISPEKDYQYIFELLYLYTDRKGIQFNFLNIDKNFLIILDQNRTLKQIEDIFIFDIEINNYGFYEINFKSEKKFIIFLATIIDSGFIYFFNKEKFSDFLRDIEWYSAFKFYNYNIKNREKRDKIDKKLSISININKNSLISIEKNRKIEINLVKDISLF